MRRRTGLAPPAHLQAMEPVLQRRRRAKVNVPGNSPSSVPPGPGRPPDGAGASSAVTAPSDTPAQQSAAPCSAANTAAARPARLVSSRPAGQPFLDKSICRLAPAASHGVASARITALAPAVDRTLREAPGHRAGTQRAVPERSARSKRRGRPSTTRSIAPVAVVTRPAAKSCASKVAPWSASPLGRSTSR